MNRADQIREALRNGYGESYTTIAKKFGVTASRVGQIARQEGIIRGETPERVDGLEELRILQMNRLGIHAAEISRQMGRRQSTIARVLRSNGRPTSMFSDAEVLTQAIKLVRSGATYAEAARTLGISRNQVAGAVYRRKKQA